MNENYFKSIDTPTKAYILGCMYYNNNELELYDEMLYEKKCYNQLKQITVLDDKYLKIKSKKIKEDIDSYGNLKDFYNKFKENKEYIIEYTKSFYEKFGYISYKDGVYYCYIINSTKEYLEIIAEYFKIPYIIENIEGNYNLIYKDVNIIDFLGLIYKDNTLITNDVAYYDFRKMIGCVKPIIKFIKTDERAITPTKANFSDVGYDLTIIDIAKVFNKKTKLYNTGIKVEIPVGYYLEIVPRSSISKSGYMLANSIGIIDGTYKGELFVALSKIDEESDDLTLPFKCCQMILKKQIYPEFVEIENFENITKRNEGGFGSTSS